MSALISRMHRRWLSDDDVAPALLFTALAAFVGLIPVQNDTFWHLRSGQQMWQTGSFLLTEPFSHTSHGAELHNHWWLTQLAFFGAYSLGGPLLLTLFAGACAFAAVFGSWRLMRGPWEVRIAVLAVLMLVSAPGWSIRPQVVSFAFIVLMAHLIVRNRLAWLPVVCMVWANSHALVIFGVVISGALVLEALLWSRRELRRSIVIAALCVAAPMVSPLGAWYWPQVLATVSVSKDLQIQEYRMPFSAGDLPFWVAAATLVVLTITQRRRLRYRQRSERALLVAAFVLMAAAIVAARNAAVFVLIAAPVVSRLWPAMAGNRARNERPLGAAGYAMLGAAAVVAAAMVVMPWRDGRAARAWHPVSQNVVEAVRTCPDPIFNRLDDGGYLMWTMPERRVFVDSRMEAYTVETLRYSRAADTEGDYAAAFQKYGINCAVVATDSSMYSHLLSNPSMTLTFSDSERAVFTRSGSSGAPVRASVD
jgi:hypothetical protein